MLKTVKNAVYDIFPLYFPCQLAISSLVIRHLENSTQYINGIQSIQSSQCTSFLLNLGVGGGGVAKRALMYIVLKRSVEDYW